MSEANALPLPRPLLAGPVGSWGSAPPPVPALDLDYGIESTSIVADRRMRNRKASHVAKHHYVQRQKFHLAQVASMPATAPNATFTASRAATDTMVRSLWSPQLVSQIDPVVNPPVEGWWVDAEVQLSMRFEKGGTAGPGSGPFLASTFGTVKLYPTFIQDSTLNATQYVVWAPLESPTVIETSRKGDGTHTPFVNVSMWAADFHAAFANPGGAFSVKHSVNWTGTVVWASDVP